MNFSILSNFHKKWLDILVIGRTIERDGRKYHIIGMTLSDEAKLYIIEPYDKQEPINIKGTRSHRRLLKEHEGRSCCYLHCSDFHLGSERLQIQGGMGNSMGYSTENYEIIQLFLDMPITINPQPGFPSVLHEGYDSRPQTSAFALSLIADKGVLMSWERESSKIAPYFFYWSFSSVSETASSP